MDSADEQEWNLFYTPTPNKHYRVGDRIRMGSSMMRVTYVGQNNLWVERIDDLTKAAVEDLLDEGRGPQT